MADKYFWHERVHKKYREELIYFQLTFDPVYRRDEIFESIKDFLNAKNIHSYCLYEIFGHYDLILRIWLPSIQQPSIEFRKELENKLIPLHCIKVLPFRAEGTELYWLFEGSNKLKEKDIDNLSIDTIQNFNQHKLEQAKLDELVKTGLLQKYEPREGIKFFVVIPHPSLATTPTNLFTKTFTKKIRDVVLKTDGIIEPSVYFGDGFAWIFIKGKVICENYRKLNDIVQQINEAGVGEFQIRTYTYIACGSTAPYFLEEEGIYLPAVASTIEQHDIIYYLNREEDEKFEVKGSFSLNIDLYLRNKKLLEADNREQIEKTAKFRILKSVIGFLNSDGGTILLGAIEAQKYIDVLEKSGNPLQHLPRFGNRIIFGIESEFDCNGWDGYRRKLYDYISGCIGKDVSIDIKETEHQGKKLCLIGVPKGLKWYYPEKGEFFVRRGNETVPLSPVEADSYKNLHPR